MWPAMFSLALRARAAGLSAQWVRGWGGPGHCRHHRPLFVPPLALVPGDLPSPHPPRALDGSAGGCRDAAAFVLAAAGMLRSCGLRPGASRPYPGRERHPELSQGQGGGCRLNLMRPCVGLLLPGSRPRRKGLLVSQP